MKTAFFNFSDISFFVVVTVMAPALTKIVREGQSLLLASPPPFGGVDSEGRAVSSTKLEPDIISTGDNGQLMMMGLNSSSFSSLESFSPLNFLNPNPANPSPSSHQKKSVSQVFLLSPLSVPFSSENQRGSQQEVAFSPGAHDTFSGTVLQHNSQEARFPEGLGSSQKRWPDGVDVHSPSDSVEKIKFCDYSQAVASPEKTVLQDDGTRLRCPPPASVHICSDRWNSQQLPGKSVPKEEVVREQEGRRSRGQRLVTPNNTSYPSSRLCVQGYDTTASSSSDYEQVEELDGDGGQRETTTVSDVSVSSGGISRSISSSSCEQQWLEERAELGSRWSWLQQRLSNLERWIRRVEELRKQLRSVKGRVVFAPPQDLSERHSDAESCSPTRMLHNMEKQSLLVSSLIPPLGFSPPSEHTQTCRVGESIISGLKGSDTFVPGGTKRRKTGSRRQSWSGVSRGCARSRPLLLYHRRILFTFNTSGSSSSHLTSSSDPLRVSCCNYYCSSSSSPSSRKQRFKSHPDIKKERHRKPRDVVLSPMKSHHRREKRSRKKKQQLQEILTPRWRLVSTQLVMEKKSDDEEGQAEDLSDEAFARRHWALEQREKLRWSSWNERKSCRRPTSLRVPGNQQCLL